MGPSYITKVSLFMQAQFITLWWFNGSFHGQILVHILQTVALKQMIKDCEDLVLSCWQIMKSFIFICFVFFILCYTPVLCSKFSAQRAWLFFWKMQETLQASFGLVSGFFEMMKTDCETTVPSFCIIWFQVFTSYNGKNGWFPNDESLIKSSWQIFIWTPFIILGD